MGMPSSVLDLHVLKNDVAKLGENMSHGTRSSCAMPFSIYVYTKWSLLYCESVDTVDRNLSLF